jgi:hypothetical protein
MAAKLSDVEIFYVENNLDVPDAELAKTLKRSLPAIKKIKEGKRARLAKESAIQAEQTAPQPEPAKPAPPTRKAFGHVNKNGHSLATIMTPAASERGDESRKQGKHKVPFSEQFKHCTFKPYGDDHGE